MANYKSVSKIFATYTTVCVKGDQKRNEIVRDMYEKIHELILKQLCVVVVVKENCCTYHTGLLNKKFVIFVSPTGFEIHLLFSENHLFYTSILYLKATNVCHLQSIPS